MARIKESKIEDELSKKSVLKKDKNVKLKNKKIKKNNSTIEEMEQSDIEAIQEENFSILFIFIILLLCFVAGISLGYCLYKIALSSAIIMI